MSDGDQPERDPEIDAMMAEKRARLVLMLLLGGGGLALLAFIAFASMIAFRVPF